MKHAGENGVAEEVADERVRVGGAVAFGIALHALAPFLFAVAGLVDAGDDARQHEGPRVGLAFEEELKLLPRGQRKRVAIGSGVEGRHDAGDALMFLLLQLVFGLIVRGLLIGCLSGG
jgi:hypothetical protein